jgi:DNA helicase-2/ATP-dependent DNA helicase PcrA
LLYRRIERAPYGQAEWYIGSSENGLRSAADRETFQIGDRVRHSVMGAGEIVDIDTAKGAYVIRFDALETVRSISFKAKLTHTDNGQSVS